MQPDPQVSLVKYQYDALNRLVASAPSAQDATQRFYLNDRLVTEVQGTGQRSIMQFEDQLLAQHQHQSGAIVTGLLAADPQRSVLNVLEANRSHALAYTAYGHRPQGNGLLSLLGFNGERADSVTGCYLLGSFRAFNPVLMRFNRPDSFRYSPFGKGGVNAYDYCGGDPVNRSDPSGHVSFAATVRAIIAANRLKLPKSIPKLRTKPLTSIKKLPTLLEVSAQKFSSKQLSAIARSDHAYSNIFNFMENKFGDYNLSSFLSKSTGTWEKRIELASSGNAPGFFLQRVQPIRTHVSKFEHSVGTINHLTPTYFDPHGAPLLQRNIRMEIRQAKERYGAHIASEIADI